MKPPRKRETFIALRARRQGHRVASEIINPHMELPQIAQPRRPVEEFDRDPVQIEWHVVEIRSSLRADLTAIVTGALIGLVLVVLFLWMSRG